MLEKLCLQGEKRRDTSWYREAFQRRRRSFSGARDPRGDYEQVLRAIRYYLGSVSFTMDISQLISNYGYGAVAAGCLLEGETVLLLAGFAAHRGYLSLAGVIGVAAAAGFLGDLFFFFLGRRHGSALLARWPSLAGRQTKINGWIERYRAAVIMGVRFTYGFRVAGPVLIGMSNTPTAAFVLFNAIGAMLWAALIAGVGWFFGEAAQRMLGPIHHLEKWLALSLLMLSLAFAVHAWWRRR